MARIYQDITELIGNTPLLRPARFLSAAGLPDANLLTKLEGLNPGGSVKDRAALGMILDAERQGLLKPGDTLVESTSGNTGIAMAMIAAIRGYRMILTMPETMSVERRRRMRAVGAEIVLTPASQGMAGAGLRAKQLLSEIPGARMLGQFDNPANPKAHAKTAQEIWDDTDGAVDVIVAGVGTGGTLTGIARTLKEKKPSLLAYAVEPDASPVLSGGQAGPHPLQGLGAGFVPGIVDKRLFDGILPVSGADAQAMARLFAEKEGWPTGYSGGAALFAACAVLRRAEMRGKCVVTILPDIGDRYLSTDLYAE